MTRLTTALAAAALAIASVGLAACGGDDETTTSSATTTSSGATGATGSTGTADGGASYDMSAEEFIAASLPDQVKAVQDYVADNPDTCGDVDAKAGGDFQVAVAISAASADPGTPLSDVLSQECESAG